MTTRRRGKTAQAVSKRFVERANELLASLGARPAKPGSWHQWLLDTRCGVLGINVHENWLACRFEDVDRARPVLYDGPHSRLNRHSGKWNFHFQLQSLSDIDVCLELFKDEVRPLLSERRAVDDNERECASCHRSLRLWDECEWDGDETVYCWGCAHDRIRRLEILLGLREGEGGMRNIKRKGS